MNGYHAQVASTYAVRAVYVSFAPRRDVLAGLWCHGVACSESTCSVNELFDGATVASVGTGASCSWKDDTTVLITFGQRESFVNPGDLPPFLSILQRCRLASGFFRLSSFVRKRVAQPECCASPLFFQTFIHLNAGGAVRQCSDIYQECCEKHFIN